MPAFGVAVIVFGGLLSTMSALNATVMAASRVAFSMVNLSVIALRRKYPEIPRRYRVPLYPVVPFWASR